MGGSGSATAQDLAKWDPKKLTREFPFGNFAASEFYQEQYAELFEFTGDALSRKERIHNSRDLAFLLLGCLEQIDDPQSVLETILASDLRDPHPAFCSLSNLFDLYVKLSVIRSSTFVASACVAKPVFSPFSLQSGATDLSFDAIYAGLHTLVTQIELPRTEKMKILDIAHALRGAPAVPAMSPPVATLSAATVGNCEVFSSGRVFTHGIASNGQFVFVLCADNTLRIYPVFLGGLSQPIVRKLPNAWRGDNVSLIAHENTIVVYYGSYGYEIQIVEMMSRSELFQSTLSSSPSESHWVGNGVRSVRVTPDGRYEILSGDWDKHLRGVFKLGNATLHEDFPALFPQNIDWSDVPMETNGVTFSMIFTRDQSTAVNRMFCLATGCHLCDQVFDLSEQLIAVTIDAVNHCHWGVVALGPGRYQIKRYSYLGGCDPSILRIGPYVYTERGNLTYDDIFATFVSSLHFHVRRILAAQMIPKQFLCTNITQFDGLMELAQRLSEQSQNNADKFTDASQACLQDVCALISANLKLLLATSVVAPEVKHKLCTLITTIPRNLGFLIFFGEIDFFLEGANDFSVTIMVELLKSVKNSVLLSFALRQIRMSSNLALIPIARDNSMRALIPQTSVPSASVPDVLKSLMLIHQQTLVAQVRRILSENPFTTIQLGKTNEEPTIIDNFRDYCQLIIQNFDAVVPMCKTAEELEKSLIMLLFKNFTCLLSSLSEFHSVSILVTALLAILIQKLSQYIVTNLIEDATLHRFILFFIFIYGKFTSTLVMGGYVSDFERKYLWLIRANLSLVKQPGAMDNLVSPEITGFPDERIQLILQGEGDFMSHIYRKYKPQFNRRLSEEVQKLDRMVLCACAKHTDCLTEMFCFDGTEMPSRKLKTAFDQMLKVRSEFRTLSQQQRDANLIFRKCLMLLRMESDGQVDPKLISEFIISPFDVDKVCQILKGQETRISTILMGFSLIDKTYKMNAHPIWTEIIAYCLSQIERFEGLASILQITKFTPQQTHQVDVFFGNILEKLRNSMTTGAAGDNDRLLVMAFRFFRDINCIPSVQEMFCQGLIQLYHEHGDRHCLLATAFALVPAVTSINAGLATFDASANPLEMLLLAEAVKYVKPDSEFVQSLCEKILSQRSWTVVSWLRILYHALDGMTEDAQKKLFESMFDIIGDAYLNVSELSTASDMIQFCRQILKQNPKCKPVLVNLMRQVCDQSPQLEQRTVAVLAILGSMIDNFRPFARVRYVTATNEVSEFIAIPEATSVTDAANYIYYTSPFNVSEPPKSIPDRNQDTQFYAIPVLEASYEDFPYADVLINMFNHCFSNLSCVMSCMYGQALAAMCKSAEFVSLMTREMIDALSNVCVPINTMYKTLCNVRRLASVAIVPDVCGYSVLSEENARYVSYVSRRIKSNGEPFTVKFTTRHGVSKCFAGIISDTYEYSHFRYTVLNCGQGKVYPIGVDGPTVRRGKILEMTIDPSQQTYTIGNHVIRFPVGLNFRILFAAEGNNSVTIETQNMESVFCDSLYEPNAVTFFDEPFHIDLSSCSRLLRSSFPSDPHSLPPFPPYLSEESEDTLRKQQMNWMPPPDGVTLQLLHSGQITSQPLVQDMVNVTFGKLGMQWCTVALMRIACIDVERVKGVAVELFTKLVLSLEVFSEDLLSRKSFPFSFSDPIWEPQTSTQKLFMLLDHEAKVAIRHIVNNSWCLDRIGDRLIQWSSSKVRHLISIPHAGHTYISYRKQAQFSASPMTIVCFNDFRGYAHGAVKIGQSIGDLPLVTSSAVNIVVTDKKRMGISTQVMDPRGTAWLCDTAFELILLLKNFAFMAKTHRQRVAAKTALLNCYICQSPFILKFLPQIAEFIQVQIPSTPLDKDLEYVFRLMILGAQSVARDDAFLQVFYRHEQRVLTAKIPTTLTQHFPEFSSENLSPPTSDVCTVSMTPLDPGAIKVEDMTSHILMLKTVSKQYRSLVGFPFWEILPLWLRVTGAWHGPNDYIEAIVRRINNEVSCVVNPGSDQQMIVLRPRSPLPQDAIIMTSQSPLFEDAVYLDVRNIHMPIAVNRGETYFSIVGCTNPWEEVTIEVQSRRGQTNVQSTELNIPSIHDRFLSDMTIFAINWTRAQTDELISIIPRFAVREETFKTVESFAKSSSLCSRFPQSVVLLRAVIIHHFNYIKSKHGDAVPASLWETSADLLALEDAEEAILESIATTNFDHRKVPAINIDRHSAQRLVMDQRGDSNISIIAQLSRILASVGATKFRNKSPPWFVRFKNEDAIDAGGPSRELVTEAAMSIFDPTSELFMPTPDMRHGHEPSYVPIPFPDPKRDQKFWAVGVLLGIIVRCGFYQDLPFAQLIWNFLAGEKLTDADVVAVLRPCLDVGQCVSVRARAPRRFVWKGWTIWATAERE